MQYGSIPDASNTINPAVGWNEIVHRDLKPGNVFLERSTNPDHPPSIYTMYDRPVLGDYGIALKTYTGDPFNPRLYNNRSGTRGFLRPEQHRHIDGNLKHIIDEWQLNDKTIVYGVGLILWCMIMRTTHPPERLWLGDPALDTTFDIPVAAHVHYSQELRNLVRDCLRYDQAQRPDFLTMLATIGAAVDEAVGGSNLSQNMRSGNATPAVQGALATAFRQERYQMGLAADARGIDL